MIRRAWLLLVLLAIGCSSTGPFADLRNAELAQAELTGEDLSYSDLSGADLAGADLRGAKLVEARLVGANLAGADLSLADLSTANLTGANLSGADLRGADLTRANLTRADLRDAKLAACPDPIPGISDGAKVTVLQHAVLQEADLRGADAPQAFLLAADLRKANLSEANLDGASLVEARLDDARLFRTSLRRAQLSGSRGTRVVFDGAQLQASFLGAAEGGGFGFGAARLIRCSFLGADLRGAKLGEAQLLQTDLREADLREADLTQAFLAGADLTDAQLPEGFSAPSRPTWEELIAPFSAQKDAEGVTVRAHDGDLAQAVLDAAVATRQDVVTWSPASKKIGALEVLVFANKAGVLRSQGSEYHGEVWVDAAGAKSFLYLHAEVPLEQIVPRYVSIALLNRTLSRWCLWGLAGNATGAPFPEHQYAHHLRELAIGLRSDALPPQLKIDRDRPLGSRQIALACALTAMLCERDGGKQRFLERAIDTKESVAPMLERYGFADEDAARQALVDWIDAWLKAQRSR